MKDILLSNRIKPFVMLFVFVAFFLGIILSIVCVEHKVPETPENIAVLNTDWYYIGKNGNRQAIVLPFHSHSDANTPVSITRTLPPSITELDHYSLCFRTSQQDVDVYLEGELIYHYDSRANSPFGKASFSRWNLVELPPEFEGKELTITTISPYDNYSGKFNTVVGGHDKSIYSNLIKEHLIQFIIGVFLILMGFLFCIVSLLSVRYGSQYQQFGDVGFLILLIGLWLHSECKMPDEYMLGGFAESIIGYNSILLMPLPIIQYVKSKTKASVHYFLSILFYVCTAFIVFVTALQFTGIRDYMEMLIFIHALLLITASIGIFFMWLHRERKLNIFEKIAFSVCLLSVVIELGFYIAGHTTRTGNVLQIGICITTVFIAVSEISNLINEARRTATLSEQLKTKQAYIISSQMKPHFIYNALGVIGTMIYTHPDNAYKAMNSFTNYLRSNIGSKDLSELIPFNQELEHIKAYCDIEHYRFGDRIKVLYTIESSDFFVPPISIQPLVENAIKHGVFPKGAGGTVTIQTSGDFDETVIKIIDDGKGFDTSKTVKDTSVGLANITYRLEHLCNAIVVIESEWNIGTTVTITIPKRRV